MSASFAELNGKVERLRYDLGPGGAPERLLLAKAKLAPLVAQAVSGDIGDTSMSGWWRGAAIDVSGVAVQTPEGLAIEPEKRSRGPMRVLQQGRNQGNAAGFAGPGISRTTGMTARTKSGGVRKTRAWKAKRWNGTTTGKNTWSDAEVLVARDAGRVMNIQKVHAMRKHFG